MNILTIRREIIWILCSGATSSEFSRRGGVHSYGIGAKEGVHVAFVFAGQDNGVDVLEHDKLGGNFGPGASLSDKREKKW